MQSKNRYVSNSRETFFTCKPRMKIISLRWDVPHWLSSYKQPLRDSNYDFIKKLQIRFYRSNKTQSKKDVYCLFKYLVLFLLCNLYEFYHWNCEMRFLCAFRDTRSDIYKHLAQFSFHKTSLLLKQSLIDLSLVTSFLPSRKNK